MKYPLSIRVLHWLVAVLILGLLALGAYMTPFDMENMKSSENLYFWHKSFGMLALGFIVLRVINRIRHQLPELPQGMPRHEQLAAKVAHKALYVLMVVVPVLGYVQSSAYEFSSGVHFFFVDLPELVPESKFTFDTTNFLHKWAAYTLLVVICAHVAGAIKHRFFDKENDVLGRML